MLFSFLLTLCFYYFKNSFLEFKGKILRFSGRKIRSYESGA